MTDSQGEIATVIEQAHDGTLRIVAVTHPMTGEKFTQRELRNAYLAKAILEPGPEDHERELINKFLCQVPIENDPEKHYSSPRGQFGLTELDNEGTPVVQVFAGKKYKPVAQKIKPVYQELPDQYRIIRDIKGDPLEGMPELSLNPPEFTPTGRYTQDRKEQMDKAHSGNFLWPEERKLVHQLVAQQNEAFAWEDSERGRFRADFFPDIEIPTIEHTPWVLKNIPIPPGMHERVMEFIRVKLEAGTYEPSNSSYRSRWFTVMKKDGKSFRIVHSLEPLNAVTIAHSGLPPAAESLAEHFAGRACGGILDLYVGYDERVLAEKSRDLTTFQTPFGALRLTTLPMGWTNSVPIFHDDVTYILKEEMPEFTKPYIDDVPIRGPATRYELEDGGYEVMLGNGGIRRFVWEHMQAVNRIVQRMKYAGGTFSGYKSILCAEEITVVGHVCTYEGRKPGLDKLWTIANWGPCKDISDVRSFMGTIGLLRIYITDYAARAEGLQKLMRGQVPFTWGPEQIESMKLLKEGAANAKCVKPLDYSLPGNVVLAVDTSWRAVGYYIYQENPEEPKKKTYARFGSILLSEREMRFSQPKRELFGLLRALHACYYWLIGVRRLVVETDAKYLKGMLTNPGMGPNATINRWIDHILMFQFELRHVAGKTFGADGLSRREGQPGDEQVSNPEEGVGDGDQLMEYSKKFEDDEDPLEFEEFKTEIDTRGGYTLQVPQGQEKFIPEGPEQTAGMAQSFLDFRDEIAEARLQYHQEVTMIDQYIADGKVPAPQEIFLQKRKELEKETPLPFFGIDEENDGGLEYDDRNRTDAAREQDKWIPEIRAWLKDREYQPQGMSAKDFVRFTRQASHFFVDDEGRLYRRSMDGEHRLFVDQDKRMAMLKGAHESLGHRGSYATHQLLARRFWWPQLDRDVYWHVKTCHRCQERQKALYQIPRIETFTPSIFQQVHMDTLRMTPKSQGCAHIVHARCALTSWAEGRALKHENSNTIADWMFTDIICRWGCIREVIIDNGGPFVKAIRILGSKYNIKGIRISPYNSQANGKIERPHWDVRQMLYKAVGKGHLSRWFKFLPYVLWADRISIRKGTGCSPFFLVTGAHPLTPLDIQEATWLVTVPDRMLTTEELIGFRARALARHKEHVEEMRERVSRAKRRALARFEQESRYKIRNFDFKPGDLVLVRNSSVEKSLDSKMQPRYNGPMIVIARKRGGAYVLAEMNGYVSQWQVAAAKVIPYFARRHIKLPDNIYEVIDQTKESLSKIIDREEDDDDEEDVRELIDEDDLPEEYEDDQELPEELLEDDPDKADNESDDGNV